MQPVLIPLRLVLITMYLWKELLITERKKPVLSCISSYRRAPGMYTLQGSVNISYIYLESQALITQMH